MAASRTLSNPTVEINDEVWSIVPNSFSYKKGKGNKTVKTQSAGGDAIDVVITEDAETKKSMAKFKLFNTAVNLQGLDDWLSNFSNTIRAYEGEIVLPFQDMVITEEPEVMIGADGEFEIAWEGSPIL